MNGLAKISLLLVIVLVSLSAYLRLAHSGIGCADWPACYGQIGEPPSVSQPVSPEDAYQRMGQEANQPMAWATPLHRLVASVLGLLVFFLVFFSLRQKRQRLIWGFAMLGLLGWMVFSAAEPGPGIGRNVSIRNLVMVAIAALCLQILLGGLTSANFAATSCQTLPDCHGSWLPGSALMDVMNLSRQHEVTGMGQAVGGEERLAIHKAHRLGALLTFALVLIAGLTALRANQRYRLVGIVILVLLTIEFTVGVTAVLTSLPIGLAVAHNWLAGLLLLALLKLLVISR